MEAKMRIGSYFDCLWFDSRDRRLKDIPKIKDTGFDWLASNFTPDDEPVIKACQDAGIKILFSRNVTTLDQAKVFWDKYSTIDGYIVADDANYYKPDEIIKVRDEVKKFMRPDMKTFITVGKGTDPNLYANLCDWYGKQNYVWKEPSPSLKMWYWDKIKEDRAICKGRLIVHPYLGKNGTPQQEPYKSDPVWNAKEYTPVAYNEAAIWASIAAGADDILFYTLYNVYQHDASVYNYVLERWDLVPAYKEMFQRIRSYEKYLEEGTRLPFENGRIVGATFTLPTGEYLKVEVDTFERNPKVDLTIVEPEPVPGPVPPKKVTVNVKSDTVMITGEDGIEFQTSVS